MSPSLPQLETERLILRPPQREDLDAWTAFLLDAEVQRFLGGVQQRPIAWRQLCIMAGSWTVEGFSMFSVIEKDTGRWIGRLGPWRPEGWPGTEVGWGLTRDAWGKGYATEGAAAAIDWAFDTLGWTEVIHTIVPENVNSQAVAKRLGSTLLRKGWLPEPINLETDVWGQTREQWLARRR
ncbi:GNAT family N-acetyltransferase [Ferrovibrio sp.]|uniref:GNAT family N-acetyltransferase n=1 Tax=Ferrovibrio sp. TaxID=1917215 RepID=UPI00311E5D04